MVKAARSDGVDEYASGATARSAVRRSCPEDMEGLRMARAMQSAGESEYAQAAGGAERRPSLAHCGRGAVGRI